MNYNTRLEDINARKLEIRSELENNKEADLDAFKNELDALEKEETEIRSKLEMIEGIKVNPIPEEKKQTEVETRMNNDYTSSLEYRQAFMNFAKTGKMEFRDGETPVVTPTATNAYSQTSENTAVIPATTLNMIVEKMEKYGEVYPLVRKMSYPAGIIVPTSTLAGTANWIGEGDSIEVGKKTTDKITFSAYQLACALGITFLAQVQSLEIFEAALAENIARNMVKKLDAAIVNGDGNGKPTGILQATPNANHKLTMSYAGIIALLKAQDPAYTNSKIFVSDSTFYDIMGITDENGQPVARVNSGIANGFGREILGKQIVTSSQLPAYSSAANNAVIGFMFNPDDYVLNTAYQMDMVTYVENETRNKVYQSVGVYDGKVVDNGSLVIIKK